jgi:nitroreductase
VVLPPPLVSDGRPVELPEIFDPGVPEDAMRLERLRGSGAVWRVDDAIEAQLRDLVKSRCPGADLTPEELDTGVTALVGGGPLERWGRWVFYPWSGRLVHVLAPCEFRELRLDRNRYKLTLAEEARLGSAAIGVVGLSVGNAVALTLALEGAFGELRLADHDLLDLSNTNRIRASVADIGLPKTVLAARQIWEVDPYARLSLFHEGVTEENLDHFLDGLDVVVDECDSLHVKFLLRERARERRLPVVMETSDRGLLDVERFDLEPGRSAFHGLAGDLTAADVRELDRADRETKKRKAVVVIRLLDAGMISTRLAVSMLEVESSISTWPQLASDVVLGGASAAVAVRRIVLGRRLESGRRYVDLETAIAEVPGEHRLPSDSSPPLTPLPRLGLAHPDRSDEVPELVRYVVAQATLAPSGGNAQPWHFYWGDDRLWVAADTARMRNVLNSQGHATWLALGAAIENAAIAAASRGRTVRVTPFPHRGVAAVLELAPGGDETLAALLPLVAARQTNRRLGDRAPFDESDGASLRAAAAAHGGRLQLVSSPDELEELGRIAGRADRIRFTAPVTHRELMGELRWNEAEAEATRDGVTVSSLELKPVAEAALMLLRRPDVAAELRALAPGRRLEEGARDAFAAASAAGLLTLASGSPAAWLAGGRAMQRLWLEATALGLAFQPIGHLYMFELLGGPTADLFTAEEREELEQLQAATYGVFARAPAAALLFRLARVDQPGERSLRLPPDWVTSAGVPAAVRGELVG